VTDGGAQFGDGVPAAARPNVARLYDYLLGGKDNYAADREVGDRIRTALPQVHLGVQQQRAVLQRVVAFLVREVGLRQLIDIGSGLPTARNVHEVAREVDPATRTVYVDNEPVVLAHAQALLADNPETIVIDGDLRGPEAVLADPRLRAHLDLGRPVGLLLCGILHHILDEEDPAGIMRRLQGALAPGSHVFVHHLVTDGDPATAEAEEAMRRALGRGRFRTVEEVTRLFDGLELVPPGVVHVPDWRPDEGTPRAAEHPVLRLAVAGVGRKP
jgi:S-adenosyl methyltransferase